MDGAESESGERARSVHTWWTDTSKRDISEQRLTQL